MERGGAGGEGVAREERGTRRRRRGSKRGVGVNVEGEINILILLITLYSEHLHYVLTLLRNLIVNMSVITVINFN